MRVGLLLLGGAAVCLMLAQPASGGSSPGTPERQTRHAEAGRALFNGKGACSYCHGVDGRRDKLPRIDAHTAALIARLDPAPADLRNPKTLRLKSDRERMKAIREGHPGTGMFPDTSITDEELTDTLVFLELLRHEGTAAGTVSASSAGNAARGKELYYASCVVCHGKDATGHIGPRLAGNAILANDQAFRKTVHEGQHMMPHLKDALTEEQITDILAWLRTLP